jgi:hypothetical protein
VSARGAARLPAAPEKRNRFARRGPQRFSHLSRAGQRKAFSRGADISTVLIEIIRAVRGLASGMTRSPPLFCAIPSLQNANMRYVKAVAKLLAASCNFEVRKHIASSHFQKGNYNA